VRPEGVGKCKMEKITNYQIRDLRSSPIFQMATAWGNQKWDNIKINLI
jgi:hypothetical protein